MIYLHTEGNDPKEQVMANSQDVLGEAARLLSRLGIRPHEVHRKAGYLLLNPWAEQPTSEYLTYVLLWLFREYTTVVITTHERGLYIQEDKIGYPHLLATTQDVFVPTKKAGLRVEQAFTFTREQLELRDMDAKVVPEIGLILTTPLEIKRAEEHILLVLSSLFGRIQKEGMPFYDANQGYIEIRDRKNVPHRIHIYAPL